jgi:outer membrane PBP1 activator LpoA protein
VTLPDLTAAVDLRAWAQALIDESRLATDTMRDYPNELSPKRRNAMHVVAVDLAVAANALKDAADALDDLEATR